MYISVLHITYKKIQPLPEEKKLHKNDNFTIKMVVADIFFKILCNVVHRQRNKQDIQTQHHCYHNYHADILHYRTSYYFSKESDARAYSSGVARLCREVYKVFKAYKIDVGRCHGECTYSQVSCLIQFNIDVRCFQQTGISEPPQHRQGGIRHNAWVEVNPPASVLS